MTREEFLKEIDKLDDEYFQKRWKSEITRLGEEKAIEKFNNYDGYKKSTLDNYRYNVSHSVSADIDIIKMYNDILQDVGESEFIEKFGEFKLFLLNNAIKRQREGIWGYILKEDEIM